jgi:hypothetical protein
LKAGRLARLFYFRTAIFKLTLSTAPLEIQPTKLSCFASHRRLLFVDYLAVIKEHQRMKLHNRFLALVCLGACSSVFAADPPPAASPPAAGVNSAAQTPAANAPATATAPATAEKPKDGPSDAEIKAMRAQGYKPETHAGVTYYCRSEPQLGSRFEKKTCGTAADITTLTNQSKDALTNAQKFNSYNPKGN